MMRIARCGVEESSGAESRGAIFAGRRYAQAWWLAVALAVFLLSPRLISTFNAPAWEEFAVKTNKQIVADSFCIHRFFFRIISFVRSGSGFSRRWKFLCVWLQGKASKRHCDKTLS